MRTLLPQEHWLKIVHYQRVIYHFHCHMDMAHSLLHTIKILGAKLEQAVDDNTTESTN